MSLSLWASLRHVSSRFQVSVVASVHWQSVRWARRLATTLKAGQTVILKDKLYTILKATHTQGTARQVGNVQLELRDVQTHFKHLERLRSSADIEVAHLASQKWHVLYKEGDQVICMHPETYDQMTIPLQVFGDQAPFVWSGMEATVESFDGDPVVASLPAIVEMNVQSVDAEVHDGMRRATLENGREMKLPSFVKAGDVVTLNVKEGGTFVKRLPPS